MHNSLRITHVVLDVLGSMRDITTGPMTAEKLEIRLYRLTKASVGGLIGEFGIQWHILRNFL